MVAASASGAALVLTLSSSCGTVLKLQCSFRDLLRLSAVGRREGEKHSQTGWGVLWSFSLRETEKCCNFLQ